MKVSITEEAQGSFLNAHERLHAKFKIKNAGNKARRNFGKGTRNVKLT